MPLLTFGELQEEGSVAEGARREVAPFSQQRRRPTRPGSAYSRRHNCNKWRHPSLVIKFPVLP